MGREEPLSATPPPNPPRSLLYKLEKGAGVTSEKPARGQSSPWERDPGSCPWQGDLGRLGPTQPLQKGVREWGHGGEAGGADPGWGWVRAWIWTRGAGEQAGLTPRPGALPPHTT